MLVVCAIGSHAQAEPVREAPGETIEVTELRRPRAPAHDPAAVYVLEREDLELAPAPLFDDVVRTVPSAEMFRRSSSAIADPTSQGLNLRGLAPSGTSRALVLRDGVPINDPFGGWVYWRALPVNAIARVEIQPTGASAVFGNFALGGVLAIASRPIEERALEVTLAAGSRGTLRGAVRAAARSGAYGVELDGDGLSSDGYVPVASPGAVDHAAASSHRNAGIRVERAGERASVRAFARWFDEELDAGTRHTTADVRTRSVGAGGRLTGAASRLDVAVFGGDQLFEQERARVDEQRSSAETANRQRTPSRNAGASAVWTVRAGPHTLQVGGDALHVAGTATDALSPAVPMPGSLVERSAGGVQRSAGVFVQDSLRAGRRVDVAAAVRLDRWWLRDGRRSLVRANGERELVRFADRAGIEIDPRLGAIVHLDEDVSFRASVYRAFRAPTLNELYRPFQVGTVLTAANEQLRAETLWGGEAGPQVTLDGVSARATGFYNRVRDPIFNVTLAEPVAGAARQRRNVDAARVAGVELEGSWRPARAWSTTIAYTVLDAEVVEAAQLPGLVGKRLAQNPRSRASLSLAFDDPAIATLAADLRYVGVQFEDDLNTLPMGAYVTVDGLARRSIGRGLSVFATVHNALDRRYLVGRAGVDTVGQPRTVLVGVTFAESITEPRRAPARAPQAAR